MSHYVHETDADKFNKFLRQLVDAGCLKGMDKALGITLLVIDKGRESLTPKQDFSFQKEVMEKFVHKNCKTCGNPISWGEMFFVEDGQCSECQETFPAELKGIRPLGLNKFTVSN